MVRAATRCGAGGRGATIVVAAVDVAAAGGWANVDTMKKSYQHADPVTTLEVLENPKAVGEAR